jgi:hypothetical protein
MNKILIDKLARKSGIVPGPFGRYYEVTGLNDDGVDLSGFANSLLKQCIAICLKADQLDPTGRSSGKKCSEVIKEVFDL